MKVEIPFLGRTFHVAFLFETAILGGKTGRKITGWQKGVNLYGRLPDGGDRPVRTTAFIKAPLSEGGIPDIDSHDFKTNTQVIAEGQAIRVSFEQLPFSKERGMTLALARALKKFCELEQRNVKTIQQMKEIRTAFWTALRASFKKHSEHTKDAVDKLMENTFGSPT